MKNFEELLDRLNADHTRKLEKKFEKEITSQILYYYEDFVMDLEDDSYLPLFTSEDEARLIDVNANLYAGLVEDIPNENGYEYVLNPMNQAILFDQSIWTQGSFEVLGTNSSELMFMIRSKDILSKYSIREAYIINVKDNGRVYAALVLDGIPQDDELNIVGELQLLFEGTSIRELFSTEDKQVHMMVKGLKPYFKSN